MRGGCFRAHRGAMTRIARADVVLLVLSLLFGALTVSVAYGFALEYGDTGAGWWASALDGLRSWWFGIVVVAVLTVGAVLLSWGSLLVRTASVVLVLGTVVGTGAGAAVGVEQKLSRYPTTPRCTEEFTSGPAVPVVTGGAGGLRGARPPGPVRRRRLLGRRRLLVAAGARRRDGSASGVPAHAPAARLDRRDRQPDEAARGPRRPGLRGHAERRRLDGVGRAGGAR